MATNSSLALHPRDIAVASPRAESARPAPRKGLLRRAFDVIVEARQRQAEHLVASYLARTGMKFTDSTEREIENLLAGNDQKLR